jgi:hypothetical protein
MSEVLFQFLRVYNFKGVMKSISHFQYLLIVLLFICFILVAPMHHFVHVLFYAAIDLFLIN